MEARLNSYPNTTGPRRNRRRSRRQNRGKHREEVEPYKLAEFVGAYAVALIVCGIAALALPPLLLVAYPTCGLVLSRFVGRRVVWWTHTASIENIMKVKLTFALTW